MTHSEIREKFRKFFESKKHGSHLWKESSSLLPTDPSVLFTTAGMQQFKEYYTHPENAPAKNVVSIQKCLRTSDIDEVGDESHLTFFEMLGNFSFGGYWKKEAIQYSWEFLTEELKISKDRIHVTVLDTPALGKDNESFDIWKSLGLSEERIKTGSIDDNFWGPTGSEGPCGPTTEIYVDGVEIWNIVFNQYFSKTSREQSYASGWQLKDIEKPGIDTGMGLERLAMVVQGKENIFETDLLQSIIDTLPTADTDQKRKRIIADHARASAFLISDGISPSNKEQGYVLRRLLRRMIVQAHLGSSGSFSGMDTLSMGAKIDIDKVFERINKIYSDFYPNLNIEKIKNIFGEEFNKFNKIFKQGLREIKNTDSIDAQSAFKMYESFGLTYEIVKDVAGEKAKSLSREAFDEEFKKHQEMSRAGAEKKFGGHGLLLDTGELKVGNEEDLKKATRLHTATHLLHASLRKILGTEVHQAGSDITPERLRFDFTFPRKVTPEEIKQIEDLVNEAVHKDYKVTKEEMSYEDAIKSGAMAFFKLKYPPRVNVYSVGDFSKELCGGPHVSHSAEIGKFKITKEESVSAGVRRIRATVD